MNDAVSLPWTRARFFQANGIRLAASRSGAGFPTLFLHGWPGLRSDWRRVRPALDDVCDCVAPDLRGFGESECPQLEPSQAYTPDVHVADIVSLIDGFGWEKCVIVAHDLGATIAQRFALSHAERVAHLVLLNPPYGGIGMRRFNPDVVPETWYQYFHETWLVESIIDGRRDAVGSYLRFIMSHWNAPSDFLKSEDFERLVDAYARPGAFTDSVKYYRARSAKRASEATAKPLAVSTPTTILWGEADPIMRVEFADKLDEWFEDYTLTRLPGVGHFVALERPEAVADAVRAAVARFESSSDGATRQPTSEVGVRNPEGSTA